MNYKFDPKYYRVSFSDWSGDFIPFALISSTVNRPMVEEVDFIIDNKDFDVLKLLMMLGYTVGVAPTGTKFRLSVPKQLPVDLPLPIEVFVNDSN